ncbi:bifunctional diguanylate cyclase/phosphodiesterase [Luteimonas sp. M1R5S18]|uniref:Bifunctional diguanylate cyclase/phosphodiesterase n=1 Tax=Luteimonas rhizosphaericola TaxID=3042024 RepID=A0ABT6JFX0_9GAMM|nr:bifunctional diguanylate cyclase/phosphodiesterase [Luteimonas rhizosphaericola]MDH5828931.1 bifunctional diguanylate cyclase/phosphodiesterase [Luteimonas rhizosphaericola]
MPMLAPRAEEADARSRPPQASAAAADPTSDGGAPAPDGDGHDGSHAALLTVATELLDCPCALLWLVEDDGLRLVATRGLALTPVFDHSRLHALVSADQPVAVVPDTRTHPVLAGDPVVTGAGLHHVAAAALLAPDGTLLGVIGVGDACRRDESADTMSSRLRSLAALATRTLPGTLMARCRQVAEAGFSAIVVVDGRGSTIFANGAARELLGAAASPGQPVEHLVPLSLQLDPDAVSDWLHAPASPGNDVPSARELRIRDALGELRVVEAVRCSWHDGIALVLRDITDHGGARREPPSGRRDPLTGLPNREALFASIGALRGRGARLGVALLGLDNFRAINEALGHVIGDTVLQVVACRLMAWLPTDAQLVRFGGDEFAILFETADTADALEPRLQALLRDLARPCEVEHQRVHVEACIGLAFDESEAVAAYEDSGSSGLLALAALALRHAKRAGTLQLRRFTPAMREEAVDRRHLDLELRRAFRDGEFELHYQPQIDLASGVVSGAEALLRWRHPERGLLMPVAFIDALARSAIAPAVGNWILQQACRDAAGWPVLHGRRLKVGVNLFPAQFNDDALVEKVDAALRASGLPADQLEIELTETIALRDDGVAEKTLLQLRSRGIRVSYDDFGTGHASLSMLHRLPVDRVKIDRSFVRDLVASRGDKAIVRSITLIAKNFDMEVIAEGVESRDQVVLLREFGCHEVQGFLYSMALAPRLFERWLSDHVPQAASAPAAARSPADASLDAADPAEAAATAAMAAAEPCHG